MKPFRGLLLRSMIALVRLAEANTNQAEAYAIAPNKITRYDHSNIGLS